MEVITQEDKMPMDEGMFVQVKGRKKRRAAGNSMEVKVVNGVQGIARQHSPVKRAQSIERGECRKVPIPPHRYGPLKENWMKIFTPVVEHLQLQIRINMEIMCVELRSGPETSNISNLQRGEEFVKAFILGFEAEDALGLLRFDDLFLEVFEIQDVKRLKGDHRSRAIGRLAGKDGQTKFAIEDATRTRIVLADAKIHILGSYENIQIAKRAVCSLILGRTPSKVHGQLRYIRGKIF